MLKLEYKDYTLDFKFEAGTSRGVLKKHLVYLLKISENGLMPYGYGEAAPLDRLSVDSFEGLEEVIEELSHDIQTHEVPEDETAALQLAEKLVDSKYPSLRFGLEVALLDLLHGGERCIFKNAFFSEKKAIPINGLIWMGDFEWMKKQVDEKLAQRFNCIKVKVGAIDWGLELDLIKYIRSKSVEVTIRLDANGGFPTNEVFQRLNDLEPFHIHSIEQPIMPRQPEASHLICQKSKIPIALDEELIGVVNRREKRELLEYIAPAFIILKPTLVGGIKSTLEWIQEAEEVGIAWWMTSALESNIGLNAISQFAGSFEKLSYQGLGTGQLYHNNIKSPLVVKGEELIYDSNLNWDLPF